MNTKLIDKIFTTIIYLISGIVLILLISLIGYILFKGRNFLDFNFLLGSPKVMESGGGIGPQIFNSFYMLIISLMISIPFGLGGGIYLAEYAKKGKLLDLIRLCIETMASLPSIVVGLFGLLVFVNMTKWGFTLLSGALAVSILNLPQLTRVSENSIRAVPQNIKEASLGLGATKFQTIWKVILPTAFPQILTGIILSAGRIFGEAAALLYTSGMSSPALNFNYNNLIGSNSPFSVFRPAETLAVYIWKVNSEGLIPDAADIANKSSAVLIVIVLIFNVSARALGKKIHETYTGRK